MTQQWIKRLQGLGAAALVLMLGAAGARAQNRQAAGLQITDLTQLRSAGEVALSPDGKLLAYTVTNNDRPGRPYSQLWVMTLGTGQTVRLGAAQDASSNPVWSRDGRMLAWQGRVEGRSGLIVSGPDGANARWLASMSSTNAPLPNRGATVTWSPDGRQIAFVSSTPGPESSTSGDPIIITRYLYSPTASEGMTHFNDNRRLHIFIVDVASGSVRQLTRGDGYEHSIDWSPDGKAIVFASNRSPYADQFFQYDLFTVDPDSGAIHALTHTEYTESKPVWSPDGSKIAFLSTTRGLTDRETAMDSPHVWVMDADGSHRRRVSPDLDAREQTPLWTPEGDAVYFTAQQRGSVILYRQALTGGSAQALVEAPISVGAVSAAGQEVAYAARGLNDEAELFLAQGNGGARQLTHLNTAVLGAKKLARVEAFTFTSNDHKYQVEAFLTVPPGDLSDAPGTQHPLIVSLHGGPHGQSGPTFNFNNQIYASLGWAVLQVNYRGSTGYGQAFADGVFGDQDGNEGQDVLYAVSAALRRNPWIDATRMGIEGTSYGGQLTEWLITQTREFKAAVPTAGITNLISYNYLTYYNQYEQMEFGEMPHQGTLMDKMWRRSALRYIAQVATPTLILHGANDPDVPVEESQQYYIALKDVGVPTELVLYPREGHGLREIGHKMDGLNRSIAWYRKYFEVPSAAVPIP